MQVPMYVKFSRKNKLPDVSHNEIAMTSKTKNRMIAVLYFFTWINFGKSTCFSGDGQIICLC